eukprot:m.849262 g.849262  ORF g.849262 m.849262 type:complete len:222 (-) comp23490_c2_seq38:3235-3900(-)
MVVNMARRTKWAIYYKQTIVFTAGNRVFLSCTNFLCVAMKPFSCALYRPHVHCFANFLLRTTHSCSTLTCSCKRSNITVIFEHNASALFVLTHFVLRAPPKGNFTAPIADAVLFVSQTPLTIKGLQEYDDYTRAEYDSLLQEKNILGKSLSEDEPAGFLSIDNTTGRTIVHTLSVPRTGRYIGVKFLRSTAEASSNANIDVEYVGFKGFTEVKGFAEGTIR